MIKLKTDPARGVLPTAYDASRFCHLRVIPAESLRPFVEHFWRVAWNLDEGVSHEVETLPHPSVHVTVEPGRSGIGGIRYGRFVRRLEGASTMPPHALRWRTPAEYEHCQKVLEEATLERDKSDQSRTSSPLLETPK